MADFGGELAVPSDVTGETFVTYAQGKLKVFNSAKNFGYIQPIWRAEDVEGPPLKFQADEGLWFFGNHSLIPNQQPGISLSFEVWENSEGKPQARGVQANEIQAPAEVEQPRRQEPPRRHPHEPRQIYPSVYISDVPVEYTEDVLRKLHRTLGLNPDTIMGLKFLPFTEVSIGEGADPKSTAPQTGSVIVRYLNEEAANAACERLRGHPIRLGNGSTKYLGARHAAPAKWMMERKSHHIEEKERKQKYGEALKQKITGSVVRVSAAGYGVIKNSQHGEVMWRQYELPTNIRSMQFANPQKFQEEAQNRDDYKRLKEMEGCEVEAELYKMPDGQLRASHVKVIGAAAPAISAEPVVPPQPEGPSGIVIVRPVPGLWNDAELRERFEWYGSLTDAVVVTRVQTEGSASGEPCWLLGILKFDDSKCAEEVIKHEHNGSLDGQVSIVVEAGSLISPVGWCDGNVIWYSAEKGVGLIRSAQVRGDIHFEASAEVKASGMDMKGMRVDASVEYGGDGIAQSRDVRIKEGGEAGGAGEKAEGSKKKKQKTEDSSRAGVNPYGMAAGGGMGAHAAGAWGMYPGAPPPPPGMGMPGAHGQMGMQMGAGMGGPNDPYFKTQPCPYLRMGNCPSGPGCYFAHSPSELRPAPEAMMMNQMMKMMGGKKEKKNKKEKKEKKEKRMGDDGGGEEPLPEEFSPRSGDDAAAPGREQSLSCSPGRGGGDHGGARGSDGFDGGDLSGGEDFDANAAGKRPKRRKHRGATQALPPPPAGLPGRSRSRSFSPAEKPSMRLIGRESAPSGAVRPTNRLYDVPPPRDYDGPRGETPIPPPRHERGGGGDRGGYDPYSAGGSRGGRGGYDDGNDKGRGGYDGGKGRGGYDGGRDAGKGGRAGYDGGGSNKGGRGGYDDYDGGKGGRNAGQRPRSPDRRPWTPGPSRGGGGDRGGGGGRKRKTIEFDDADF